MNTVGFFGNGSPKSAVIGIALADNDDGTFTEEKAVPASTFVAEKVFQRRRNHHMRRRQDCGKNLA